MSQTKEERTPEDVLREMGAQVVFGEWRFPFYGKDTVAQMLPLAEWLERRRMIGHHFDEMREALEDIANSQLDPSLGQIVGSEHYENAWLLCSERAKAALLKMQGGGR